MLASEVHFRRSLDPLPRLKGWRVCGTRTRDAPRREARPRASTSRRWTHEGSRAPSRSRLQCSSPRSIRTSIRLSRTGFGADQGAETKRPRSKPSSEERASATRAASSFWGCGRFQVRKRSRTRDEGLRWLRAAAKDGLPIAQSCLGLLYASGLVVEQDEEKAARLYRKAAEYGDPLGQTALALASFRGVGISAKPPRRLPVDEPRCRTGTRTGSRLSSCRRRQPERG